MRAALIILLAAACASSYEPGPEGTAEVRVFHAVADLGSVTVLADGDVIQQGVPYGKLTGPAELSPGTHTFQVGPASAPLATRTVGVNDGQALTLVLTRTGATLQLNATADTGLAQPDRGNLRLISTPEVPRQPGDSSAFAQAGLLDVYVTAPGASLAAEVPRLSMDTGYPSYSTFLYYTPGDWTVRFTRAGTKDVVAASDPIRFAAGDAKAVVIRRAGSGTWTTRVESVE